MHSADNVCICKYEVKLDKTGVVCFSFFFWLRVLDKAEYSAFESTLNSRIVSYRIVSDITRVQINYRSNFKVRL